MSHEISEVTWRNKPALQLSGPGVDVCIVRETMTVVSVNVGGRELLAQPADVAEVADITPGAALIMGNHRWSIAESTLDRRATDGHAAVVGQFRLSRSTGEDEHDTETRTVTLRVELASGRLRFATSVKADLPVVQRVPLGWSVACRFDDSDRWRFTLPDVQSRLFSEPPWRLWTYFDQPGGDVVLSDGDRTLRLELDYGLAGVNVHVPGDVGVVEISPRTAWELGTGPFAAPLHESSFTLDLHVPDLQGDPEARLDRALAGSPDAEFLGKYARVYPGQRKLVGQLAEHTRSAGVRTAPPRLLAGFAARTDERDELRRLAHRAWLVDELDDVRAIALGLDPLAVVNDQTWKRMAAWIDHDLGAALERRAALRRLLRHVALAETDVRWLREEHLIEFFVGDQRELRLEDLAAHWRLYASFLLYADTPEVTRDAAWHLVGAAEGRARPPWRGALERLALG